jgi:hypothetical protein
MASITMMSVLQSVSAARTEGAVNDGQAVVVNIGRDALYLSREEAAQLGAELLNASGAVPVEAAA